MNILNEDVSKYINGLYKDLDGELGSIQKQGYEGGFPIIPKDTANFLTTIISIKKPLKILEIGCCIGFSASLMARCIDEEGHVTTIERCSIMAQKAKQNFTNLNINNKVTLLEGEAIEILKTLNESYDLIFLDAAKGQYIRFLPHCVRLLNTGGILVSDNVMQNGDIAKEKEFIKKNKKTIYKNMREFLHAITNTKGIKSSIIPVGDGIALSVKLDDSINIGGTYE